MLIGVISDTHGLLRPEAVAALRGSDHILHAGDVGDEQILEELQKLAPITAIRGNIDRSGPCAQLPAVEMVELGGQSIYMVHDLNELDLNPEATGISAVVSGHSHHPGIEWSKGVLFFNPGSAGPRRFSLPVSLGFFEIRRGEIEPRLLTLG
jgi:putative phosphoesterase